MEPGAYVTRLTGKTWVFLIAVVLMARSTYEENQEQRRMLDLRANILNEAELRDIFIPSSRQKRSSLKMMYPGTKWCGDGNSARTYDDLGSLKQLDLCCRQHDHCNDSIPSHKSSHGLTNREPYTSSNCKCDETFRKCLVKVDSFDSGVIGNFYFDIARCFRQTYPANCIKSIPKSKSKRCTDYTFDETGEMKWQFLDTKPWDATDDIRDPIERHRKVHHAKVPKWTVPSADDVMLDDLKPKSRQKRRLIYPGTKWCGDGTIARSYDDLGDLKELDSCCREHDACSDNIPANQTRHGLRNSESHTRSHCDCDASFRKCLGKTKGFHSGIVGALYFSVAICFNHTYPASCVLRTESQKRCLQYVYNESEPKSWQFFDVQPWRYVPEQRPNPQTSSPTSTMFKTEATEPVLVTEEPPYDMTSRAVSIGAGSTLIAASIALVVTVLLRSKISDCCSSCKKETRYQTVNTDEQIVA